MTDVLAYQHGIYGGEFLRLHYHYLKSNKVQPYGKKLLMLHGSRLAGLATWGIVGQYCQHWDQIIIPDLPGIGEANPCNQSMHDFTLDQVVECLIGLINQCGWQHFDVVSYSYGGLVACALGQALAGKVQHQFMLDSAILVAPPKYMPRVGDTLQTISKMAALDPVQANQHFSSLVSGQHTRQSRFDLTANSRPIYNPLGFANVLSMMASFCHQPEKIRSLLSCQPQVAVVVTEDPLGYRQQCLSYLTTKFGWDCRSLANSHHGVVFSDPWRIADLVNQWGLTTTKEVKPHEE